MDLCHVVPRDTVAELMRLVVWRDEMGHKVSGWVSMGHKPSKTSRNKRKNRKKHLEFTVGVPNTADID